MARNAFSGSVSARYGGGIIEMLRPDSRRGSRSCVCERTAKIRTKSVGRWTRGWLRDGVEGGVKSDGRGGIEVSAFFACASRCALRRCTRWVDRTVGVGVLSAPAEFQTSNRRLGFHYGTRNAQDPPKPSGWHVRGRQIRLRVSSSSSSSACYPYFTFFFFHPHSLLLLLPRHSTFLSFPLFFHSLKHAAERLVPPSSSSCLNVWGFTAASRHTLRKTISLSFY